MPRKKQEPTIVELLTKVKDKLPEMYHMDYDEVKAIQDLSQYINIEISRTEASKEQLRSAKYAYEVLKKKYADLMELVKENEEEWNKWKEWQAKQEQDIKERSVKIHSEEIDREIPPVQSAD